MLFVLHLALADLTHRLYNLWPRIAYALRPLFFSVSRSYFKRNSDNDWMEGLDSSTEAVSSFNVLRAAFDWLAATYPSISTLVLAGHSAGGQTVQRWAVTNPSTTSPNRYVIANPSSMAWFTTERPNCTVTSDCVCTAPGYSKCCTRFNDWKVCCDSLKENHN